MTDTRKTSNAKEISASVIFLVLLISPVSTAQGDYPPNDQISVAPTELDFSGTGSINVTTHFERWTRCEARTNLPATYSLATSQLPAPFEYWHEGVPVIPQQTVFEFEWTRHSSDPTLYIVDEKLVLEVTRNTTVRGESEETQSWLEHSYTPGMCGYEDSLRLVTAAESTSFSLFAPDLPEEEPENSTQGHNESERTSAPAAPLLILVISACTVAMAVLRRRRSLRST